MTPFFTPARLPGLDAIARSWLDTPFFPHGRIKGPQGGVSCETLAFLIYAEAGFLPPTLEIPKGSLKHWYVHRESLILRFVEQFLTADLEPLAPDWPQIQPGDLLHFTDDDCEHLGIALPDGYIVHCLRRWGILINRSDDSTYQTRLAHAWRPVDTPNSALRTPH